MIKKQHDASPAKTHVDTEKMREFRSATIARIKESKLDAEKRKIIEEENKRKESQAFRVKWREKVKQKRQEEIIQYVDKLTVKESLPELQSNLRNSKKQLNFVLEKELNEKNLQSLISDLDGHDARDYLALTRDSGAFKLSISGDRIPSIEFASGVSHRGSIHYLQKIASFGLEVESRLLRIAEASQVRDRSDAPPTLDRAQLSTSTASLHKERYGFNVTNDIQMCNLVQELITEGPDNPKRVVTGVMETLLNNATGKSKPVAERTLERRNSLTSELFAQRQASMFVKMPNNSYDADEHKGLVSLCDGYYLVGPNREVLVDGYANCLGDSGMSAEQKRNTRSTSKSYTVEPQVLATNFRHELPPEMIELLPAYCFPSGVQIKGSENESNQHRQSVASKDEALAAATASADAKKPKKQRVFFPSDYSMKSSTTAAVATVATIASATTTSSDPAAKGNPRTMFVIKLGDHTYQYYCVCILQPVVLIDEASKLEFETYYCICFLMKFPFVSLITNIVELEESIAFHCPVDSHPDGIAAHDGVKAIEELIRKMKQITVQAYPFFMKTNSNEKIEQTNLTLDPSKRSNDIFAFISDVNLSNVLSGNSLYRRGCFQRYYSSYPLSYDQLPDDQIGKIYDILGKSKFVPGSSHRAERELEETFHLLLWSLPILVNYLLLDQIVLALGCAMMEMKIIVCHKDPNVVSSIIMALINLLRPLKWCSPLIISLPDLLTDFIDSPVPIIVGLRQLPYNFELQERCVLIDPDVKKIHFHPKDLIENQTIILPNGSRLAHYLRSITNTIKTVSRRKRLEKLKLMKMKKILAKNEAAGTATTSSSVVAAVMLIEKVATNPLSFENDASSEDCAALCGAINQFSATVSNHILALVNTAIQFQTDERKVARDKRRVVKQSTTTTAPVSSDSNPERRRSQRIQDLTKSTLLREVSNDLQTDISALDDSVSDITYTDISSAHKKNGSGTEVSSGESINSTTSSLPSIQTGAPILAIKDLRPYEQTFITKLTETQMYSNYCQIRKSESPPATVIDINTTNKSAPAVNTATGVQPMDPADGSGSKAGETGLGPNLTPLTPSFISHVVDTPQQVDSMVDLFYIMLNGVTQIPADTLSMYQQEYQRIYEGTHKEFKTSDCEHALADTTAKNPTRHFGKSRRRLQRTLDKLLDEAAEKELSKVEIQAEELRYCSGLLCNGFCNTDSCDVLCLAIWQRKVRLLRKRQAALQIVSHKYESSLKAQQTAVSAAAAAEADTATGDPVANELKLKFISAEGVRLEAVKHGKETKSQYMLRQKVIESQMSKKQPTVVENTPHSKLKGNRRSKVRVSAMAKESTDDFHFRIRLKTFSESNNIYVTALAKHYAAKEGKYLKHLRRKSKACLHRALFRYVHRFRARKRRSSATLIQSNFRGYRVRKQIPILVEELYARISQRMILRCLATIRIRNHIRKNAERILNVFERKKIARRLANTNIPIRNSAVTALAKDKDSTTPSTSATTTSTTTPTTTTANGGPGGNTNNEAKRQLTINERYISDAAPGLLAAASALLAPSPKTSLPTSDKGNKGSPNAADPSKTAAAIANGARPPLLQMNSTSSVASTMSDTHGKGESMPPQPPKRRNSGSGSSLSSAAYDFMVHGIKRRSIQESFRHPFANKRYSSTTPPPPGTTVNGKPADNNPTAAGVVGSENPKELLIRTGSASSILSDEGQYAPTNTPTSSSPAALHAPTPLSGHSSAAYLQGNYEVSGSSNVSSNASSPSNASLTDPVASLNSLSIRPPSDFTPENHPTGFTQNKLDSPAPTGIAELSASPIPYPPGKSLSHLSIGMETMMLSPFSMMSPSQDLSVPSLETRQSGISDPLFSPTSFPVVSNDYDESDDEEKKVNRAKTMEKKMKLNMIQKSRSKDFISSSSNDLLGIKLGSKSRSNDDLLNPSKNGEEIFSAFSDDRPRSFSDVDGNNINTERLSGSENLVTPLSSSTDSQTRPLKAVSVDHTVRTSLSLGPNQQLLDSSIPTTRSASNETIQHGQHHHPSAPGSYRSPSGERKNVTPIGRYTQSQHMIIPITTSANGSSATSSPRLVATLTEATLHKHTLDSSAGHVSSALPPTHPRPHSQPPQHQPHQHNHHHHHHNHHSMGPLSNTTSAARQALSSPTSESNSKNTSPRNGNHSVSMPVIRANSPAPNTNPGGRLSHTNSADSMHTTSSISTYDANEVQQTIQAAASALLSGRSTPGVYSPTAASTAPGIASGYGAPNVSPIPNTSTTSLPIVNNKPTLLSVPSTGETVIDERELLALSPSASFRLNTSEFDDNDEFDEEALDAERQFPAFKTLGEPVFEVYSRQQRDAIMNMWDRLVNGIEVKKHSRNSKPKFKILFCDRSMTKLSWKTPASKTFLGGASTLMGAGYNRLTGGGGNGDSDVEEEITPLQGMRRLSSNSDVNIRHSISNNVDSDRVLEFKDILDVRIDASSDVLRRSGSKGYLYGGFPTISLITTKRTLDFEIGDERIHSDLLQGFTLIRNYYQRYLKEEQLNETVGFALWHHKETSNKL